MHRPQDLSNSCVVFREMFFGSVSDLDPLPFGQDRSRSSLPVQAALVVCTCIAAGRVTTRGMACPTMSCQVVSSSAREVRQIREDATGAKWKKHSVVMRDKLGMSAKHAPWTTRPDVFAAKALAPRYQDVLDVAWTAHVKQQRTAAAANCLPPPTDTEMRRGFFVDVGQAVQRRPWHHGPLRMICQTSFVYSFEADGVIKPAQCLRLQGLGKHLNLAKLSDCEIRSLAGEGFAWPCVGSALWAAFLEPAAPWWTA